jgi:hypothetical protein
MAVGIHGAVDPLIYVDGQYTGLPADERWVPRVQSEIDLLYQFGL